MELRTNKYGGFKAMDKESILVVEDEDILRESLVDWFSSEEHKIDAAADGDKALDDFDVEDYDVMIVDLKLPGRDGLSVLRDVRVKNPKVKVIIITAYPSVDTAVEAMRQGAVDYIPKPFELNRLSDSIRKSYSAGAVVAPPEPAAPPVVEEELDTPCIWFQAGVTKKRMCTIGYQCSSQCDFHAAMMKKDKFRNDPKITPYLEKLNSMAGRNQCRYVMGGEVGARSCPNLFHCEKCQYDQIFQDKIDQHLAVKAARRRQLRESL
jgi:CheY-like chemotaxis protein